MGLTFMTAVLAVCLGGADESPKRPERAAFESFVDSYVGERLSKFKIPGVVVAIVADGQIVVSKGYGLANLEQKLPVDAQRTRFFVASITKTFTATAAMQLVERGKLSLEGDVNNVLPGFKVPAKFGRPITLSQLLTHTSGLDSSMLGMGVPEGAQPIPLEEHLRARLPERVRPPGELFSYSNRNYSLAGRLIEAASAQPFARYVEEHVLAPLGMEHSGFSLPEDRRDLAVSYSAGANGAATPWPTPLMNDLPAGGLMASGTDIARFMMAHLQDGRLGESIILQPATAQEMRQRAWAFHPSLDGMGLGFMEEHHGGRQAWTHEGSMAGFLGLMYLVPELKLGIFIESNGGSEEADLVWGLPKALLDHFFPQLEASAPRPPPPVLTPADLGLVGTYRTIEHNWSTLEKVGVVAGMAREARVELAGGALKVNGRDFLPTAPDVFERADGARIAFRRAPDGSATSFGRGLSVFERVPWHARLLLHRLLAVVPLLLFLATVVGWTIAGAVRLLRRRPRQGVSRLPAWLVMLPPLVFLGGIAAACTGPMGPFALFVTFPAWVKALFVLPLVMVVAVCWTSWRSAVAWKNAQGTLAARLHHSAIALAGASFVLFLGYWNLLGFSF